MELPPEHESEETRDIAPPGAPVEESAVVAASGPTVERSAAPALPPARPVRRSSRPSRSARLARLIAPVLFLVAVIAVVALAVDSGLIGGAEKTAKKPGPVVTKTKTRTASPSATPKQKKYYVVKAGDSLSVIAEKTGVSTTVLLELNPKLNPTTLRVGQRIKLPTQP